MATPGLEAWIAGHKLGEENAAIRASVGILTEALNYVGAEVVATVLAPGVHRRGEVSQRTDLMKVARLAGREAIQE